MRCLDLGNLEEVDSACVGRDVCAGWQMLDRHHTVSRCLRLGFHDFERYN
jgi:hypothetical protein